MREEFVSVETRRDARSGSARAVFFSAENVAGSLPFLLLNLCRTVGKLPGHHRETIGQSQTIAIGIFATLVQGGSSMNHMGGRRVCL